MNQEKVAYEILKPNRSFIFAIATKTRENKTADCWQTERKKLLKLNCQMKLLVKIRPLVD